MTACSIEREHTLAILARFPISVKVPKAEKCHEKLCERVWTGAAKPTKESIVRVCHK